MMPSRFALLSETLEGVHTKYSVNNQQARSVQEEHNYPKWLHYIQNSFILTPVVNYIPGEWLWCEFSFYTFNLLTCYPCWCPAWMRGPACVESQKFRATRPSAEMACGAFPQAKWCHFWCRHPCVGKTTATTTHASGICCKAFCREATHTKGFSEVLITGNRLKKSVVHNQDQSWWGPEGQNIIKLKKTACRARVCDTFFT